MRARDAYGRPVRDGSPDAVPPEPEGALPPEEALTRMRMLLAAGSAFAAHEVAEAVWRVCGPAERPLWQGLAQLCAALTHLQRGNATGATRLLLRGADTLSSYPGSWYDGGGVVGRVEALIQVGGLPGYEEAVRALGL